MIIFYLIGKIAWFYQCTYPVQNILTLSSIRSVRVHVFFLVDYSQPGFPFEQTMSCHILCGVKMAYRYLLMLYVHTLLVSIQLRSQYHEKHQVPWCRNHIVGWLSSIWSVKFHCFFFECSSPIQNILTLASIWSVKVHVIFPGGLLPTEDPLWKNHVLPYLICG